MKNQNRIEPRQLKKMIDELKALIKICEKITKFYRSICQIKMMNVSSLRVQVESQEDQERDDMEKQRGTRL